MARRSSRRRSRVGRRSWRRERRKGRDPRVLEIYKGEGEGGIWDGSSLGASLTDWSGSSVNQEFTFKM